MKTCKNCSSSENKFSKDKKSSDGLNYWCDICLKRYKAEYYSKNHDKIRKNQKRHYTEHREELIKKASRYQAQNRNKRNTYIAKKLKTDINYRLSERSRSRRWCALKDQSAVKATAYNESLGCTIAEFRAHLEVQFQPGMTWDNYGSYWHVDEIIPCSAFNLTEPRHQRACFNWRNAQPLTVAENISKGGKRKGEDYTYKIDALISKIETFQIVLW